MAIIKNSSQDTFVIVTNFSPFKQSSLLHLDLALFSEESVKKNIHEKHGSNVYLIGQELFYAGSKQHI